MCICAPALVRWTIVPGCRSSVEAKTRPVKLFVVFAPEFDIWRMLFIQR